MTGQHGRVRETLSALGHRPYIWGVVGIVALLLVNLARDPSYLNVSVNPANGYLAGNLLDILRESAPIVMIAVGMCLVVATSGIDLSVGSVMAVAGAVAMEFLQAAAAPNSSMSAATALLLALGLSALLGLLNGVLVAYVRLQPFITTLITMLAGRGLAKVITGGQNTSVSSESLQWIANGRVLGFPVVVIIAIAVALAVAYLVRRTALGMMIESVGINETASRMAGIKPPGLLITVYVLSGTLAGVAGVFSTATVMTVDVSNTGYLLELDAILAVVIGGTALSGGKFSLSGAVVGALLITTLDKTVVFLGVPSAATPAFKAAVIIIICLAQSTRVRELVRSRIGTGRTKERVA